MRENDHAGSVAVQAGLSPTNSKTLGVGYLTLMTWLVNVSFKF